MTGLLLMKVFLMISLGKMCPAFFLTPLNKEIKTKSALISNCLHVDQVKELEELTDYTIKLLPTRNLYDWTVLFLSLLYREEAIDNHISQR